jgi:hypothetical protein
MEYLKKLGYLFVAGSLLVAGCNDTRESNSSVTLNPSQSDTTQNARKATMVISSIPFPTEILDTLNTIHATYLDSLPNPVDNASLYSQSNSQAINIGVFGADLCYVISFEQFQKVGVYMKTTKNLTEKAGIPLAFTQQIVERCQKNAHNKDSLSRIVYESYNLIDQTLKNDQRKSMEILVLAGGWIEGAYLSTQSIKMLISATDKEGAYKILMDQKHYLDLLLNQLDLISDSPYCQGVSTSLHEIRSIFNGFTNTSSVNDEIIKALTEKISDFRLRVVKGGNA